MPTILAAIPCEYPSYPLSSLTLNTIFSVDLGDHDGTSFTWKANVAAGEKIQLSLEDGTGEEAWSGIVRSLVSARYLAQTFVVVDHSGKE